jgi:hypothetical protein
MKFEFSQQIFEKYSNINSHETLSIGSRVFPCGQTDWQADITKLMVAFRNLANAPNKSCRYTRLFHSIKIAEKVSLNYQLAANSPTAVLCPEGTVLFCLTSLCWYCLWGRVNFLLNSFRILLCPAVTRPENQNDQSPPSSANIKRGLCVVLYLHCLLRLLVSDFDTGRLIICRAVL